MLPLATFVAGSAAMLALAADIPALAGSPIANPARTLSLTCDAPADTVFCAHLRRALAAAFPDYNVEQGGAPSFNSIQFVREAQGSERLSGHLAWRFRSGDQGRGPTLELIALDAPLNEALLRDYARDLLRHSDLPL
jgi:hypothetical protein